MRPERVDRQLMADPERPPGADAPEVASVGGGPSARRSGAWLLVGLIVIIGFAIAGRPPAPDPAVAERTPGPTRSSARPSPVPVAVITPAPTPTAAPTPSARPTPQPARPPGLYAGLAVVAWVGPYGYIGFLEEHVDGTLETRLQLTNIGSGVPARLDVVQMRRRDPFRSYLTIGKWDVPLQAAIQRGGGELLNRRVGAEPTGADVVRDIVRVGYRVIADLQVSDDGRLLTVTVVVGNVRPHKRPDPQPF